jgi:hypothetical protein
LDTSIGNIERLNRDRLMILPNRVLKSSRLICSIFATQQLEAATTSILNQRRGKNDRRGAAAVSVTTAATAGQVDDPRR